MIQLVQLILTKLFGVIFSFFSKSNSQNGGSIIDKAISSVNKSVKPTVEILRELYAQFGGKWDAEVNIFGIRVSDNPLADKFDDFIGVAFFDAPTNSWQWRLYKGTTDPGVSTIKNPKADGGQGATFLDLGFQENIWVIGAHRGPKHADGYQFIVDPALIAIGAKQRVKKNKAMTGKITDELAISEWSSVNGHCASFGFVGNGKELVGPWSQGCQVIQSRKDWLEFINFIVASKRYKENPKVRWSYMLFSKEQMPNDFWVSR